METETLIRRKTEEERQRELQDRNENIRLQQEIEYLKKQKLEQESQLRIELQKWRSDAEFADRKLRNTEEELKQAQGKLKEVKYEFENY